MTEQLYKLFNLGKKILDTDCSETAKSVYREAQRAFLDSGIDNPEEEAIAQRLLAGMKKRITALEHEEEMARRRAECEAEQLPF